jgi:hypothetical protein
VAENQKLSERDRRTLKGIVSTNRRTTAPRVAAELIIHRGGPVSRKTVR